MSNPHVFSLSVDALWAYRCVGPMQLWIVLYGGETLLNGQFPNETDLHTQCVLML